MRRILTGVLAGTIIAATLITGNTAIADKTTKIMISQVVEHPALNSTREGIMAALSKAGYIQGKNMQLSYETAQGSPALAMQIATRFASEQPDLVVGIATVSAQSFLKLAKNNKVKLVFSSVTDPVGANLVQNLAKPGGNITGISNFVPLKPQLTLFKEILPGLKKLGFLYNPGEQNSLSLIKQLELLAVNENITIVTQAVSQTSDVPQAASVLASKVDAIFISNDSTALSALASIIKQADNQKIPVFVSDTDAVEIGALAALGPNQYQVGIQTGEMMVRILKGADIAKEQVEFPKTSEFYLNEDKARKLGITIPAEIRRNAVKIIGN